MREKKNIIIRFLLSLILCFSFSVTAYAANWEDFTDISGHWAEATVKKGFEDGLIAGMDETSVAPDSPITTAQMITILCRVLSASETSDISSLGIASDAWYADAAGKALKLGLISAEASDLDSPMTRQDAFAMLCKAFCLVPTEPDLTVLDAYSDKDSITAQNISAMAALVSKKLVQGSSGALNANGNISRAEFLTVLYRVASNYVTSQALSSPNAGNAIIKGNAYLNNITAENLWFDCSSESISLWNINADTLTLRSSKLSALNLGSGTELDTMVAALGTGSLKLNGTGFKISNLQIESCTDAEIGSSINSVSITGSGMPVKINSLHDTVIIAGNNNTVTLSAHIEKLKISGSNNTIIADVPLSVTCSDVEITGSGNSLTLSDTSVNSSKLTISGSENKIDASVLGGISLTLSGSLNEISLKSETGASSADVCGSSNWLSLPCSEISSIDISGSYNTVNKQSEGTVSSLTIPGSDNAFILNEKNSLTAAELKGSRNHLTINGTAEAITLSGRKSILDGSGTVQTLNINAGGGTITLEAENTVDNSNQAEIDHVLELVTLGYEGNYTLKWAQEHDYELAEKEVWVNAKGYTSSTAYLIWVNLSMQRVNIFHNDDGYWTLCHSSIVGTGAPGRGTPVGTWKTTYKSWPGWTTSTYTVKPVVGFKSNTGYAFHSRLYYPGTSTLSDSSIGFPVSHGCVRMYDEDVQYIYNNIPLGTTVVVY